MMGFFDDIFAPVKAIADEGAKAVSSVGSALNQGIGSTLTGANQFLNRGISDISNGINYNLDQFGRQIDKGVSGLGKNVERNVGDTFGNLAYGIKTGNYNPFFRNAVQIALAPATGGATLGINPDDLGKSGTQLMQEQAIQNQENSIRAQAQAREQARVDSVNSYIDNIISQRLNKSAKSNLLGTGSSSFSILTKG